MNDDDEDRAAILRRRQRLIALALTGLTGAAGCDEPPSQRAVKPERVVESEASSEAAEDVDPPEVAPQIAEGPEPYVVDPAEVQHAEEAKRRWRAGQGRPRPCLSRARPQVCLSRLSPHPQPVACLWKKPMEDGEE